MSAVDGEGPSNDVIMTTNFKFQQQTKKTCLISGHKSITRSRFRHILVMDLAMLPIFKLSTRLITGQVDAWKDEVKKAHFLWTFIFLTRAKTHKLAANQWREIRQHATV